MNTSSNLTLTSPFNLFVREDLSKEENRANGLLLASSALAPFRAGFLKLMDLPPDCHIASMPWEDGRPDFTVFLGDQTHALIECETGNVDPDQQKRYERYGPPLFWILGKGCPQYGTTWACIRELAVSVEGAVDRQGGVILKLLQNAIDDVLSRPRRSLMRNLSMLGDFPENDWLCDACRPLLDLAPGKFIGLHAAAKGSGSIRLLRPRPLLDSKVSRRGVGLAMVQASKQGTVFLPSAEHLRSHLAPSLHPWVAGWEAMLANVVWTADGRRWIGIVPGDGKLPSAVVADAFARLAGLIRSA